MRIQKLLNFACLPSRAGGLFFYLPLFLLHPITRQERLWVCGGIWLANALSSGIVEQWELEFGSG